MHLTHGLRHAQRGVGLIEVLIAVLVLSFGMLGLVGLQTLSLRNNQSALERGMAAVQTNSIVDAMRADRANARTGAYNIALGDATPTGTTYRDRAISIWRNALAQSINGTARGSIACVDIDCTIVVEWDDSRAQAGATFNFSTQVKL